jgi:hypothetical protein
MSLSMSLSKSLSLSEVEFDSLTDGSDKDLGELGDSDRASPGDDGVGAVVTEG